MAYASPMKIANGLVLDFAVDNADTAADSFLGLNASGEVTEFASIPRARVSGGGNITEATSSVLTITGGTAAVLTSGLTIQVKLAGAAQSGYLSTTDWNTFNNKLGASLTSAYIYVGNGSNVATGVAVSGDITLTNTGNVQIVAGAIIDADVNASAAIAVSKLAALTASRVLGSNGSGVIQALDTATYPSLTELSYVKGVTSAVQTQLNSRLSVTLTSPTNGDVITYNGSAWVNSPSSTGVPTGGTTAQILRKIDNTNYNTEWHTLVAADITNVSSTAAELNKLSGVTTTATQFNFLNTLSGNVQDQLSAKLGTSLTQNYMFVGDVSNTVSTLAPGTNGYVLTSVSGVPTWVSPGTGGTVTSVAASGGTTGMSFTGSPITTSGTLTLTGTLAIANGGTGLTALGTAGQLIKVNAGATAIEYFTPAYITTLANASTPLTGFTDTRILYNNGGLLAEYTISGTGNVAMTTSPVFTTPNIGVATGTASGNWFAASGATLTGNNSILGAGTYDLSLGTSGSPLDNFSVYTDNNQYYEALNANISIVTPANIGGGVITLHAIDVAASLYDSKLTLSSGGGFNLSAGVDVSNKATVSGDNLNLLFLVTDNGSSTSYINVTKDNIIMLPNSGAPTVGDVWTATDIDGSGAWSAPVGGGGLTVGTTTITSGTNTRILYNNSGVLGEYSAVPVALGGTNITSYAIGDILHATASTTLTKLASVSAGSFLRSAGVTTASTWSTVKLPDTMSALGLWVANSANTTVNLTATAGQSVRVNAGGTAWEAFTPGGGGIGGSTGGTDNSILRADGTGGGTLQNSALVIDDSGNLTQTQSVITSGAPTGYTFAAAAHTTLTAGSGLPDIWFQLARTVQRATGAVSEISVFVVENPTLSFVGSSTATLTSTVTITGPPIAGTNAIITDSHGLLIKTSAVGANTASSYGLTANAPTGATNNFSAQFTGGLGLKIGNAAAAPVAGYANSTVVHSKDVNSSSELYVMTESGAEINISGLLDPVTESGTSFTLNETHRNKIVLCTNSGVVTVTVGTGKAAGWNCMLVATHATGTITLSASGTTLNGTTVTTTQFETLSLLHYGSENYLSKLG